MMKKKVFMPLLVASMMMGIVVIHSCTKNQDTSIKNISLKALYESMDEDVPKVVDEVTVDRDDVGSYECPYCHVLLYHGDSHWHYFGTPASMRPPYGDDPEGFNVNEMMESDRPGGVPHFWGVSDCLDGLSEGSCPYSGALEGSQTMIQLIINDPEIPIYDSLRASWMLLPRFHAHKVKYRAIVNGGQNNTWHTGGGVPGWPTPDIEVP